ncbi:MULTISPECIES: aldehyde dehydrogenase family protein [Blautia]|uniref:aldehyde dehydrogenase family protein n=1 Tax=Blautia TaxID=572511 RepID=UPI000BA39EAD|nr:MULTISPECIES: aldehyde dehydrogenase family protein [Blautia]
MLIHGERKEGTEKIEVFSPYSGECVGKVAKCSVDLIPEIMKAAEMGAAQMRKMSVNDRAKILYGVSHQLLEQKERFAKVLVKEVGKTIRDACKEVERAANTLKLSAEAAGAICGEVIPVEQDAGGVRTGFYQRVPVGVVLAVTPFNFPLNLACHKMGPAFAAGNSVIVKPASKTPLTAMMLGELFLSCGLPKDAVTVVCGSGRELGNALVADSRVRKISFTGSYQAGDEICKNAGVKKITMELGSTSAVVVSKDTDIKIAAEKLCRAGFANAGQVCISVQRVYVHNSVKDELLSDMKRCALSVKCGDPSEKDTDLGPMISRDALIRAQERVQRSIAMGARLVTGNITEGNIFYPTILKDAPENAPVIQEEMFAPVITVNGYETLDEAIQKVNHTPYGLQAAILTEKIEEAMRFADEAEFGGIIINDTCNYRVDQMPYGGLKNSGIGKEGPGFAIKEMTEMKMIVMNGSVQGAL